MNRMKITSLIIAICFLTAGAALAAEGAKGSKAQTTCPVMGGKIDKSHYVDHEGQRVYFCCPGCKDTFRADPAKYLKKIEDDGVIPAQLQTTCPVMGGKIDKSHYVDHGGQRVYFCCPGCKDAFRADPAKHLKKLKEEDVVLEKAP